MEDTKRIFQMTVCNLGRVFFNGEVFTTINEVAHLASTDREAFFEGLESIKKNISKIENLLSDKPKKKRVKEEQEMPAKKKRSVEKESHESSEKKKSDREKESHESSEKKKRGRKAKPKS